MRGVEEEAYIAYAFLTSYYAINHYNGLANLHHGVIIVKSIAHEIDIFF